MISMKHYIKSFYLAVCAILCCNVAQAQRALYLTQFDLQQITLLPSIFKTAQDLNYSLLLEYDVDRLLTPFVRQAGLSQTLDENSRYSVSYTHLTLPTKA